MPSAPEREYLHLALEIAGGELTPTGHLRLQVVGDSMAPLLRAGDAVLVRPVPPQALHPGDLVAVRRGEQVITHRLIGREAGGWRTKGDNRHALDPPVAAGALLGRVVAVERAGRRVDLAGVRGRAAGRLLALLGLWEAALFQRGQALRGRRAGALLAPLARFLRKLLAWLRTAFCALAGMN